MSSRLLACCAAVLFAGSAAALELKTPGMAADAPIPKRFVYDAMGCGGDNRSPELVWSDPPKGTKSFAVLVHDPDAPTGGAGFWHWLATDIPATQRSLPEGAGGGPAPKGARQFLNDFGDAGWDGPCPPPGPAHHYHFAVYALDVEKIDAPASAKPAQIRALVEAHALAKATQIRTYRR